MTLRILLINPGQLPSAGEDQFAARFDAACFRFKPFSAAYFGIPLAIPTLAGVTPPHHIVKIVDEMIEHIDFDQPCDLVGLTAMTCKATRAYQIAEKFRQRGVPVVMGGIHASMCPDEAATYVDCVVVGEADALWPSILEDLERGALKPRYSAEAFPDVTRLPPPRHDLTAYSRYAAYFLQTTRGCPRSCKFCTVTQINGRRHRKKTPAQVVAEVQAAIALPSHLRPTIIDRESGNRRRRLASGTVFFVDDNFAFDRQHALDVCRALQAFQDEHDVHINWFTQCDVKTGFDHELLDAMKAAGCMNIFVGFESLNPAELRALKKDVNTPERYTECITNIERHGIEVTASVIVGTDHDTSAAGADMTQFALQNRIFYLFPNILTPYPGTQLMQEMQDEGRILRHEPELYNIRNVIFAPKHMTPRELQWLYTSLCHTVLNIDRLLLTARDKIQQPKRYYLTLPWRILIWLAFSLTLIILTLRGKVTFGELLALLRHLPGLLLVNGSLAAVGFIVNSIGFGSFARSELLRFPVSAGATWDESPN